MCGISGLVSQKSQHIQHSDQVKLQNSLKFLKSRGPDAQASCQGENWILGHTRLSIIDLQGGKQPMQDPDTEVTVSYNGEIYNYRKLRSILKGKGHSFTTESDTEVLLKSYLEWGRDCLYKLEGCFAFAIVDPRSQELLLARDRLGVKPLYYCHKDNRVAFASSVAALKELQDCREIDRAALSHYLTTCRTSFGQRTLYQDIRLLPGGSWLLFDLQSTDSRQGKYWQRPVLTAAEKEMYSRDQLLQQTSELVETAVRDRLVSDVPVGCFLSGGLDSAIVSSVVMANSKEKYPLFCAGTPFDKYNEFEYAREMAESLKAELEEVRISPETFFDDWQMLIGNKGMPLSTPNETSIYRLAKALSRQCKVTLTGEGADEVFGGYLMPHFGILDFLKAPKSEAEAQEDHPLYWKLIQRYGRPFFFNEADHFFLTHSWMPFAQKMELFSDDFWGSINDDDEVFSFYENFFDQYKECSPFDKRMHLHAEVNLEGLLNRVDSSTMAASVEARVPFTDHRVVEFAFRQADHWKMDFRDDKARQQATNMLIDEIDKADLVETKRMLRGAFQKRLPANITQRKKMSFPVPFREWLADSLVGELRDFCIETSTQTGLFRPHAVEAMFDKGDRNLWLLANTCLWLGKT